MLATHHRRLAAAVAVAATLPLAACGDTSTPPPHPGTVTVTTEVGEALDLPEQQEIDKATARKALPTLADMPDKTWHIDTSTFGNHTSTYDPPGCASILFDSPEARTFTDDHRTVHEQARFSQNQADGGLIIATYVQSFDEPYPLSLYDEAGEEVTGCDSYTQSRSVGESKDQATAITVPQLGDRTFGVRIRSREYDHSVDRLYVRSGHNVITVLVLSREESYDGKLMTRYAQGVLDDLKKAT